MIIDKSIFKDYDIRAVVPKQLDAEGMYKLGLTFVKHFSPKSIAIGRDMRLSGDLFFAQLSRAFIDSGVEILDLGLITTDMSYFASATLDVDLSLMITASHNPPEYNGLKITTRGAVAVSGDNGIYDLQKISQGELTKPNSVVKGTIKQVDIYPAWLKHSLSFVDLKKVKPLNLLVDAGNGMAGKIMEYFAPHLPVKITPMYFDMDGSFPNHLAYPLLPEATRELRERVVKEKFDLGISWDGDADRTFLVDDKGRFVDGTALGGMLADYLLTKEPGQKVIYNAIIGRQVEEIIRSHGGEPIRWRVGHALLKAKMREVNGLLAVEHSGHFFYRNNFHCDAGIITFLLALEIISDSGLTLSQLHDKYRRDVASGEINFSVKDKEKVMRAIEIAYKDKAESVDWLDGVTVWYKEWWFNVRPSNTQPLLRLNIEVNSTNVNLTDKINQLTNFISSHEFGGPLVNE